MIKNLDATPLIGEYVTLVSESRPRRGGAIKWHKLRKKLAKDAEWSDESAAHLVMLARCYGAFMLRNALALASAADIEDGSFGF